MALKRQSDLHGAFSWRHDAGILGLAAVPFWFLSTLTSLATGANANYAGGPIISVSDEQPGAGAVAIKTDTIVAAGNHTHINKTEKGETTRLAGHAMIP